MVNNVLWANKVKDWQQAGEVRYWVYSFLAMCFYEIPQQEKFTPFYAENVLQQSGADQILSRLAACLEEMNKYSTDDWQSLREEYQRIFPESGPMLVHPWESVYRNKEHVLFDEHTLAVQECMHSWGLTMAAEERIPADHVGLECSFMASLIALAKGNITQAAWAGLRKNYQAQHDFLKEHLRTWTNQFSKDLHSATTLPFYKALADFFPAWLAYDQEMVEEILAQMPDGIEK